MLTTIAAETGPDVFTLLDAPYWRVLYCFYHIIERQQREALQRRLERVDAGMMVSLAFNAPSGLSDELASVHEAIRNLDRPADAVEVFRRSALALAARMEQGRVLSPDALVS